MTKKDENEDKSLWTRLTNFFESEKDLTASDLPNEKTSRTLSSNHTLHGKIQSQDLGEKGHNFDTTEVEMGKLGLHEVNLNNQNNEKPHNYSNVDNATLTGLKIDRKKSSLWEEITKTNLNIFTSNSEVQISMPRLNRKKNYVNILSVIIIIGAILLAVLYGVRYWNSKKDQVMNANQANTIAAPEESFPDKPTTVESLSESVNYNAIGRGLIYNCKEKHWACIDKTNYIKCGKLANSGSKDCMVKGVLKTIEACVSIQKKFISTNENTDFCL